MSHHLKEKDLVKKQANPNRSKNKSYPNPYLTSNSHFAFRNQIIPEGCTDENDGDGNENYSY